MHSLMKYLDPSFANYVPRVYDHRSIAEGILGRKLLDNEVIHHIDHFKSNGDPSNLCVMSKEDHEHYHNWHRWMENNRPEVKLSIQYKMRKLKDSWNCEILGAAKN